MIIFNYNWYSRLLLVCLYTDFEEMSCYFYPILDNLITKFTPIGVGGGGGFPSRESICSF